MTAILLNENNPTPKAPEPQDRGNKILLNVWQGKKTPAEREHIIAFQTEGIIRAIGALNANNVGENLPVVTERMGLLNYFSQIAGVSISQEVAATAFNKAAKMVEESETARAAKEVYKASALNGAAGKLSAAAALINHNQKV